MDFLANLVARASQTAPVLQRRQPGLFEAPSPWSAPGGLGEAVQVSSIVQADQLVPAFESDEARSSEQIPRHDVPATTAIAADSRRVPPSVETPPSVSSRREAQDGNEALRFRDRAAAPIAVPHLQTPEGELAQSAIGVGAAAHFAALGQEARSRDHGTADLVIERRPPSVQRDDLLPSLVAARPISPPRAPALVANEAPRMAQAVQLAKSVQLLGGAGNRSRGKENSTVQVTIGRVEVKAVAGGERVPTRGAKSNGPRLTLDDYLRDRSGGRR